MNMERKRFAVITLIGMKHETDGAFDILFFHPLVWAVFTPLIGKDFIDDIIKHLLGLTVWDVRKDIGNVVTEFLDVYAFDGCQHFLLQFYALIVLHDIHEILQTAILYPDHIDVGTG